MGPDGHILKHLEFYCRNDEEAKDRAKHYVDGYDVELWHRDQKIAQFKSKP
jgi:hypothetical protein